MQVIVPELREPKLDTPQTRQSTDKKSNDGLVTNQSEASNKRCRLVAVNRTQQTSGSKNISDVTGSGVAYTEQDVTPSCDKNLRYIMWNVGCQDEIHPLRHHHCQGNYDLILRRDRDDRGRVDQ